MTLDEGNQKLQNDDAPHRAPTCPRCLSRFRDIRGMVFIGGIPMRTCDDAWHGGDPDILILTDADQEWLAAQNIGF